MEKELLIGKRIVDWKKKWKISKDKLWERKIRQEMRSIVTI
ncbi:hypothetical protein [Filifactor alocis]